MNKLSLIYHLLENKISFSCSIIDDRTIIIFDELIYNEMQLQIVIIDDFLFLNKVKISIVNAIDIIHESINAKGV